MVDMRDEIGYLKEQEVNMANVSSIAGPRCTLR